ncbi:MAG: amylo-alpha-1,6-glucosidase [Bacteriovoracales bacterium]
MEKILILFIMIFSFGASARTKILPCPNSTEKALSGFMVSSVIDRKVSSSGLIFSRLKHVPKVFLTTFFKKDGVEIRFQYGLDIQSAFLKLPDVDKKFIWDVRYDNLRFFTRIYPENSPSPAEWDFGYLFKKNPNLCGISLEDGMLAENTRLENVKEGKAGDQLIRGNYFQPIPFDPKTWVKPDISNYKKSLPNPIWEGDQGLIDMYWFAWKLALEHFRTPEGHPGTASPYMDENFSDNFFQWDTAFMLQFGNYLLPRYNPIASFDNFYNLQHHTGKIWKEYSELNGEELWDLIKGDREINPPLFAWAEWEAYKISGDKERLTRVFQANEQYLLWLEAGRKANGTNHRLYWNTPIGCGMDNIPVPWSHKHGWVDMSSQMVLAYKSMAKMAGVLGWIEKEKKYLELANVIAKRINDFMWDDKEGIYFDIDQNGERMGIKHIGLFWPLLAGITSKEQEAKLIGHLKNPNEFNTDLPFATLSKDNPKFRPLGNYWRGGVWAPTNYMVIKGLAERGYEDDAFEFSRRYLKGLLEVYSYTNTLWEAYAPLKSSPKVAREFGELDESKFGPWVFTPGKNAMGIKNTKRDFVGWTGVGPINLFLENLIGIRRDVIGNKIFWRLGPLHRHGIENLPFGDGFLSLVCEKRETSGEYTLNIDTTKLSKSMELIIETNNLKKIFFLRPGRKFSFKSNSP